MSGSDDLLCVALLFCATFGVGSMSFGSIFAAAGPVLAAMAVYFISSCNLHARLALTRSPIPHDSLTIRTANNHPLLLIQCRCEQGAHGGAS